MELHGDAAVLEFERIIATPASGSPPGAEGSWVEMVPEGGTSWTAPSDIYGVGLHIDTPSTGGGSEYYIDIGVSSDGGATIHTVLDELRYYQYSSSTRYMGANAFLPLCIPRGYSIHARVRNTGYASAQIFVALYPCTKPMLGKVMSRCLVAGVSLPADTAGFSTWAEVSPSLPFDVRYVVLSVMPSAKVSLSDGGGWVVFGAGAAGAEKRIAPKTIGFDMINNYFTDQLIPQIFGHRLCVPKGERLVIAHKTTSSSYGYHYNLYLFGG